MRDFLERLIAEVLKVLITMLITVLIIMVLVAGTLWATNAVLTMLSIMF